MELLDALGWEKRSAHEEVVVGFEPWRLVAVLARLCGSAALAIAADENEGLRDARDRETLRRRLAVVTCARVMGDLAREQQSVAVVGRVVKVQGLGGPSWIRLANGRLARGRRGPRSAARGRSGDGLGRTTASPMVMAARGWSAGHRC
jgi:hypothetical protein